MIRHMKCQNVRTGFVSVSYTSQNYQLYIDDLSVKTVPTHNNSPINMFFFFPFNVKQLIDLYEFGLLNSTESTSCPLFFHLNIQSKLVKHNILGGKTRAMHQFSMEILHGNDNETKLGRGMSHAQSGKENSLNFLE